MKKSKVLFTVITDPLNINGKYIVVFLHEYKKHLIFFKLEIVKNIYIILQILQL